MLLAPPGGWRCVPAGSSRCGKRWCARCTRSTQGGGSELDHATLTVAPDAGAGLRCVGCRGGRQLELSLLASSAAGAAGAAAGSALDQLPLELRSVLPGRLERPGWCCPA